MLRRCHGTNLILPTPEQGRFWCIGPSSNVFSTSLERRVNFQRTFFFRERWLDVGVTGNTCNRGVAYRYLKTNDGSREWKTRIALISYDVFYELNSRLRSTHGRKKRPAKWRHRSRSGAFEGVAVQGRRLSRRSGPLRLDDRWLEPWYDNSMIYIYGPNLPHFFFQTRPCIDIERERVCVHVCVCVCRRVSQWTERARRMASTTSFTVITGDTSSM